VTFNNEINQHIFLIEDFMIILYRLSIIDDDVYDATHKILWKHFSEEFGVS